MQYHLYNVTITLSRMTWAMRWGTFVNQLRVLFFYQTLEHTEDPCQHRTTRTICVNMGLGCLDFWRKYLTVLLVIIMSLLSLLLMIIILGIFLGATEPLIPV